MDWPAAFADAAYPALAAAAFSALALAPSGRALLRRALDALGAWSGVRTAVVVVAAVVLVRAAFLAAFEPRWESDVREYVEKAEAILRDGHPRAEETNAAGTLFYRPLGMSVVLAGWYLVTQTTGLFSARVFGIVAAAAAALLIVALGRALRREREGRLAALLYAVYLPHAVFATIPYTETFVTALVVGASVLFERVRRGESGLRAAAGFGFLVGWIGITRTELLLLFPAAVGAWAVSWRPQWVRAALLTAVAGAAAWVPFAVNSSLREGYPGTLRTSVQGGLILWFGNNPIEVSGDGNATPAVVAKVREMYAADPTGATARDAALAWLRDHPLEAVANAPKKAWHLWLCRPQGFGWHARRGEPEGLARGAAAVLERVAWAQSLAVLALGALVPIAMRLARRRGSVPPADRDATRFWTWSLVLHVLLWCALAASARNRYPLEPWLLLTAAMHAGPPRRVAES